MAFKIEIFETEEKEESNPQPKTLGSFLNDLKVQDIQVQGTLDCKSVRTCTAIGPFCIFELYIQIIVHSNNSNCN